MDKIKERNVNLDLIRALALVSIPVMHFYDNSGFYSGAYTGLSGYLVGTVRLGMSYCVPVFLMLSGYLCRNKRLSKSYYVGFLKVGLTYLVSSLMCIAFEVLYLHEPYGPGRILRELMNFEVGYGWYVMLYFGLFLMIPFLNLMFSSLQTRGQRLALVATFFVLSCLPSVLNAYVHIYSLWWTGLYPLCYYFTGSYLAQEPPKWSATRLGLTLLGLVLAFGAYDLVYFQGDASNYHRTLDYANYQIYIISLLLFRFCQALDLSRVGKGARWIIYKTSQLSLAAYLCSWIPDGIIYRLFVPHYPDPEDRYIWMPLLVLLSLGCSLVLAQVVHWIYEPLDRALRPWLLKLCRPREAGGETAP